MATRQSFLPPRSPLPSAAAQPYNAGSPAAWRQQTQRHHHQRTSSESFIVEEQPSWLDDLLDEPETPVAMRRGGHRRSSSDSFAAFFDPSVGLGLQAGPHEEYPGALNPAAAQWGPPDGAYYPQGSRGWDAGSMSLMGYRQRPGSGGGPVAQDRIGHRGVGGASRDFDVVDSMERRNNDDPNKDLKVGMERMDGNLGKHSPQLEAESKRAKQQYAQRSRVRKLQYIAELERKVQALEVDGVGVTAEIDFLGQQNIMLDLENKALKQRLESLAQEQLIKRYQQEMFEREITRLRSLYQQQQQHSSAPTHSRSSSRDLDTQFANLSLKHKDNNPGWDPITGSVRI